jgi:polyisoprenoid-binding protein YceI
VTGDLSIKGTTKPVTLDVEFTGAAHDPMGNDRIGFEIGCALNRKDCGITWNAPLEAGGVLVGDKLTLDIDVSAVKRSG